MSFTACPPIPPSPMPRWRSSEELDLILQDSTIIWYDIPLDYEIEEYGSYYHDPTIPDSLPTFQYASIEVAKWPAVPPDLKVM